MRALLTSCRDALGMLCMVQLRVLGVSLSRAVGFCFTWSGSVHKYSHFCFSLPVRVWWFPKRRYKLLCNLLYVCKTYTATTLKVSLFPLARAKAMSSYYSIYAEWAQYGENKRLIPLLMATDNWQRQKGGRRAGCWVSAGDIQYSPD